MAKKVLLASVLLLTLAGCCESNPPTCTSTGIVRNVWSQVGTDVTFEHDNGQVSVMHFCSSEPIPPVWTGMRAKIAFTTHSDGYCTKLLYVERLDK